MHFSRARIFFLCLFVGIVWFGGIQHRDLFKTDEGRYAEIPREMVASGDWVTPHLDGFKYFEKPVLHYWITAAIYKIAGQHNWTARLWIAIAGFLLLGLTWYSGRRLFGAAVGDYAALMLAGSFYFVFMGHFNTLDMGLSLFMSMSLFGFLIAQTRPDDRGHTLRWMLVAWAAAALALLTKGLEAAVIPGAVLVLYSLTQRDWRVWRRLHVLPGLALFLAIAAPWLIAVSLINHDFFHFFFVVQHVERYLTPIAHRPGSWWYFVPVLLLGMLPWLWQGLRALIAGAAAASHRDGGFNYVWFLWLWAVFIFLFFSYSDSKLPSYILPLFPALALLIGRELAAERRRGIMASLALALLLGVVCGVYGWWFLPRLEHKNVPESLYRAFSPWVAATGALLVAAAIAGFVLVRRRPRAAVTVVALAWLVGGVAVMQGAQALSPVYSTRELVRQIANIDTRGAPFYSVRFYEQSLPFYLKRLVTPVAYRGELAFGIERRRQPERYIGTLAEFERRWRAEPRAYAMMPLADYRILKRQGLPMQVIARDPARVIVAKPARPTEQGT
jgi:4-amino-4-deoxy-L-arabinose transferase-like glycosyltransferase